jgi:hypothetical protein
LYFRLPFTCLSSSRKCLSVSLHVWCFLRFFLIIIQILHFLSNFVLFSSFWIFPFFCFLFLSLLLCFFLFHSVLLSFFLFFSLSFFSVNFLSHPFYFFLFHCLFSLNSSSFSSVFFLSHAYSCSHLLSLPFSSVLFLFSLFSIFLF